MTEESTTRKRGRPKKEVTVTENSSTEITNKPMTVEEENAEMVNQFKYQLMQMMQMADKLGIKLTDIHETPPAEDTVVEEAGALKNEEVLPDQIEATKPEDNGRPKAGTVLAGGNWVPWSKNDLDPSDTVEFVPQPVPSILFPLQDEHGRYKIKLDVNDLVCWLTVGVTNKVNKFFFNAYQNAYDSWKELENFKRTGPAWAPWGSRGPDGRPSWHYEPAALTFGLDIDGRYLRSAASWSGPANQPLEVEEPAASTTEE